MVGKITEWTTRHWCEINICWGLRDKQCRVQYGIELYITYLLTYLPTYLLTPWCRVLLEKLTDLQLVKKFLAFHGTRRFITALTSVRHLSLSWASPIQFIYPHPTSRRSILILSTHLRLGLPSDHHQSKNSVQKTIYCNSTSNSPDYGRMYPKHVELRIHQ